MDRRGEENARILSVITGSQHDSEHQKNLKVVGSAGNTIHAMGGLNINQNLAVTGTASLTGAATLVGGLTDKSIGAKNKVVVDVPFGSAATTWVSGAIAQPANTILTELTVIVTTAIAQASGKVGTNVGTAADGTGATIAAADDDNLLAVAGTAVAVGTHANGHIGTAAGTGSIALLASGGYSASARNIYLRLSNDSGNFTAGAFRVIAEFKNIEAQA